MNCGEVIVKYILYIFNLIFWICGALLIVLGGIMLGNMGSFKDSTSATLPILILVLGCLIFIVSTFGCWGAIRENFCCLTSYSVCVFILLCLQIALVVWIFVEYDEFLTAMQDIVSDAWQSYQQGAPDSMNLLQLTFRCCGYNLYTDYTSTLTSVPSSCCGDVTGVCVATVYATMPGCETTFVDFWSSNMNIIRYGGIGVAIIEFIALIFSSCIANASRKSGSGKLGA